MAMAMARLLWLVGVRIWRRPVPRRERAAYDSRMTQEAQPIDPRADLVAERDRLRAELDVEIESPGQMTYGAQAAAASHVFEQQRDLALRERNAQHLEEVESALARLDTGTYGTCTRCGRRIAPARLEAIPWAAQCIDCQREVGRGG
jgi:DnaK suppressor protein